MKCELCKKLLSVYDIKVQDLLQGICLNCGKAGDWLHMTPEESSRCEQLHAWLNMEFDQRKAYDRNRGS
jgi:hypothetical protein